MNVAKQITVEAVATKTVMAIRQRTAAAFMVLFLGGQGSVESKQTYYRS